MPNTIFGNRTPFCHGSTDPSKLNNVGALVIGIGGMVTDRNPAADRIAASNPRREARRNAALLRAPDHDPTGVWKAFLPGDMKQRTELSRKLAQAGYNGPGAVRNFTLVRILLGLVLPGILLGLLLLARTPGVQVPVRTPCAW